MKKVGFILMIVVHLNSFAWQTWVYNRTGHDVLVALHGIGSFAGFGNFEVRIPAKHREKFVVDTGIYGIDTGSVRIAPEAEDAPLVLNGHMYTDAALGCLSVNFHNHAFNKLPGTILNISLVQVVEDDMRHDAWLKLCVETHDGERVDVYSGKLTEIIS